MTEDRLNLILARQMPDPEKRRRATAILENNGTIAEMRAALLAILTNWGLQHDA
jgi:dephospho-CoA kinase